MSDQAAKFIACTIDPEHLNIGDAKIRLEHLLYGAPRVARDPLGNGLRRRWLPMR